MTLPSNFSPTEQLQDTIRKIWNKDVVEWFRDVGDDNWEPQLNSLRARLRIACSHKEDDSALDTLMRVKLFERTKQLEPSAQEITIFGTPADNISFEYAPIIQLYFSQPSLDVVNGESYLKGSLSFRLIDKTSETITRSDINILAQKIKNTFGKVGGYTWHKGKQYHYYKRKEQGYDFRLLAINVAEAKRIISDVLSIQGHIPEWQYLSVSKVEDEAKRFSSTPKTRTILGKKKTKPQYRRSGRVRYRFSAINIFEYGTETLHDSTGLRKNPLLT
ncbi:MAG: hypothetical protein F6K31_22230 [Symploca sp. SIO2G7]|nr:hypothetical protein [Symploca sp. SIO2G7]